MLAAVSFFVAWHVRSQPNQRNEKKEQQKQKGRPDFLNIERKQSSTKKNLWLGMSSRFCFVTRGAERHKQKRLNT